MAARTKPAALLVAALLGAAVLTSCSDDDPDGRAGGTEELGDEQGSSTTADPAGTPNDPDAPAADPNEGPNDPDAPAVDPNEGPNGPTPTGQDASSAVAVGDWKVTVRQAAALGGAVRVTVQVERTGPGDLHLRVGHGGFEHDLGGPACGAGGTLPEIAVGATQEVELCSAFDGASTEGAVLVAEGPTEANPTPDPVFLALD